VEGHSGFLGGRAAHLDEVAADWVWGGVVWDICAVWGELHFAFAGREGGYGARRDLMWDCDLGNWRQKDLLADTNCFFSQEFFKTIAGFAYSIPVVGPYLARGLQVAGDKAGANDRAHKDLPV
jgi:hypothetical protein